MAPTDLNPIDKTGATAVKVDIDYSKVRTAVAAALRLEGNTDYFGHYAIEDLEFDEAMALNAYKGSIFQRIAQLAQEQGATGDMTTVGGLLQHGLGVDTENPAAQDIAQDIAHRTGCSCHPVNARRAAEAIERIV